jgi:hypothetical protein
MASNSIPNDINAALSNANVSDMINQLVSNPDELSKIMASTSSQISPEMMDRARRMATNGQGKKLMEEMENRGFDPKAMRAQLMQQQAIAKGLRNTSHKDIADSQQVLLINTSRQVKIRQLTTAKISESAATILHTQAPLEISCSRLAVGPLAGATIKAWYDPTCAGKNKRASKLVGFPIAGDLLIVLEGGDLSEKDLVTVEASLE